MSALSADNHGLASGNGPDAAHGTPDYKAINDRKPGGAVTCPYCQGAVEYDANGEDLRRSMRTPLRYSRAKTEARARSYGQIFLNRSDVAPEEWADRTREWLVLFAPTGLQRILDMSVQPNEIEFLAIWAREEKTSDPYAMPAHHMQAAHQVPSVMLIRTIKAWAQAEGKRDEEIFGMCINARPTWPWSSVEETQRRLEEIQTQGREAHKAV